MSRREDVDNAIWSDPDFDAMTAEAKLLYLWSFTNQRCGMAGIYKVARRHMALETSVSDPILSRALAELEEARFVFYDGQVLWVRSRIKHLRTKTSQIARSIRKDVDKIDDDHPYKASLVEMYGDHQWLRDDLAEIVLLEPEKQEIAPQAKSGEPPAGGSSRNLQGKGTGCSKGVVVEVQEHAGANDDWPAGLPAELIPAAEVVAERLTSLGEQKRSTKPVTRQRVGSLVADFPDHDHAAETGKALDWWLHGRGERKKLADPTSAYRNWCANALPPAQGFMGRGEQKVNARSLLAMSPEALAEIDRAYLERKQQRQREAV